MDKEEEEGKEYIKENKKEKNKKEKEEKQETEKENTGKNMKKKEK